MRRNFGEYIRKLRLENTEYSLRELARKVKISPAYLSRIENSKEPPPSEEIVVKLADELGVDSDGLLSYANKIPPDLTSIIKSAPKNIPAFLRTAKEKGLSSRDWEKLTEFMESEGLGRKKRGKH